MSMIFRLRMLSDENDAFLRDYELRYDASLVDLHNFICKDLAYDREAAVSFFLSDREWDKLQEFTLFDMGIGEDGPLTMENVMLGKVLRQNNDRLIYLFDMFGDRAMYLELMATLEEDTATKYPRVAMSEADAPDQFESSEASGNSIFGEAMSEFGSFEGDDYYDDEI